MSGAVRPVARTKALNHVPRSTRKCPGEVEEFELVFGLSFPRGDRPTPQMKFWRLTARRASYDAARARPQISADWFPPAVFHWGLRKSGWLHSFMTMNSCTVGNVSATCAVQAANSAIAVLSPQAWGFVEGVHLLPSVRACEWSG